MASAEVNNAATVGYTEGLIMQSSLITNIIFYCLSKQKN